MAVKGNVGEVEIVKDHKLIYGVAPFKVVCFNPDMEKLQSMGINAQSEPDYVKDKTRLEIWLTTALNEKPVAGSPDKSLEELGLQKQITAKNSIFISNTEKSNSDKTKFVWINNFGQICSVPVGETPNASWWKSSGAHIAREGEIELLKFIRAWVNASPATDEVYIDDWNKLVAGNVSELNDILKDYKDNKVRSSIEITISKEGKSYAGIYPGHHEPWNIVGKTNWIKEFKVPRKNRFNSIELRQFEHVEPTPVEDEVPAAAEGKTWA